MLNSSSTNPQASVDAIANAVLYEGYILYPYRPAIKNRQRWTFGGLYPRAYSDFHDGSDAWSLQTECIVQGGEGSRVKVKVRFLHLMARTAGELLHPVDEWPQHEEPEFRKVDTLRVGDEIYQSWQEATEREVVVEELGLAELTGRTKRRDFAFPGQRTLEPVRSKDGKVAGVLLRQQQPIQGAVEVYAQPIGDAYKLTVVVYNETSLENPHAASRDEALMRSAVSTHAVLVVQEGSLISLMDPPEPYGAAVADCQNRGAWPILVGDPSRQDTMLAAPIILYDYPEVAPESPGDLFDSTEIDELLTLRIMTLTDEEKQEAAAVDPRARLLVERTEALAREQLLGLHGTVRGLQPLKGGEPQRK